MFFRCYTIEAAMEFFGMENVFDTPTKNRPNYAFMSLKEHRQRYFEDTLDKFIYKFVIGDDDIAVVQSQPVDNQQASVTDGDATEDNSRPRPVDKVKYYSRNILQYFFVLEDFRDAVREGDGKRMAQIQKDFLLYFKTDRSFNAYAIEMMVNVLQNEVLLSEREAHRAIWSQTVNWKGGESKNVEADLMQENQTMSTKQELKQWVRTRPGKL